MMTGEVMTRGTDDVTVPLKNKQEKKLTPTAENEETQVFATSKTTSNLKMKEKFSRFKKNLRKKSVSIF